jgi:alpha-mannosidase
MEKTIVYMIGQAHLDPVWLWRWTEGRAEALATSQSATDRLREFDDFSFTRGEAQIYQWIEQENPALFAEILERISQGRWHVVNGMVIQPDMNLPQGESIVRQFLLGKAYMREHLNVEPRVAYCVDSFGHAATLPQIFQKCGCDTYVFMRPGPHEMELPSQGFWWQAPDGSRVLAFRIASSYGTRLGDMEAHIQAAVDAKPAQLKETMCFFGVGNHGGGPTKTQIEMVRSVAAKRDDLDIRFGSPDAFFAAVRPAADALPTVIGELYFHAVGCYSANSGLKRRYRGAECHLLLAERIAALAELCVGWTPPVERLTRLWHDVCFQQFHDILGGCSIREAQDESIMALDRVILGAREIVDDAGRAITARVDTDGPGGTLLCLNPFPYPLRQYVEYEPWTGWSEWNQGEWSLTDDEGCAVPWQLIEPHNALSQAGSNNHINRLVFPVDLPPLGYRVYRFAPGLPREEVQSQVTASASSLENDRLLVRLDPATGVILSCQDRASGVELVGAGWNVAQVLEDTSDTWSHRVTHFEAVAGGVIGQFGDASITVREQGPLQASLLVERSYYGSTWLQQIILRHGEAEIVVRNWLFWHGQWRMLKLAFDVAVQDPIAAHDVPFGWCYRPTDGSERATQMWVDVTGESVAEHRGKVGLAVIDDGKYGCDVKGSTIRVTVLRCPPYAYHHPPHDIGSHQRYEWIDQGAQEFTLVLRPHIGDWRDARVVERAREVNAPLAAITTHCHGGDLGRRSSLASISSSEMELTALKPAQDGDGYVIRIADRHGRGSEGVLNWQGQAFPLVLGPFEVATLRLRRAQGRWQAIDCDMLERQISVRADSP